MKSLNGENKKLSSKEIKDLYVANSVFAEIVVSGVNEGVDFPKEYFEAYDVFVKEYEENKKKFRSKSRYSEQEYVVMRFLSKFLGEHLCVKDWEKTRSPTEVIGVYLCRNRLSHHWVHPNKIVCDLELDIVVEDIYSNIIFVMNIHGERTHATEFDKEQDEKKRLKLAKEGFRYLEIPGKELVNNIEDVEKVIQEVFNEEFENINAIYLFKKQPNDKNGFSPKFSKKA